ncbi:MAG TPA: tyrosine-type recombinase/integrase, partial [Tichowtungia sp.]|nr:tyrosine-type recombinase/integrase [Tichowtungia sp.]
VRHYAQNNATPNDFDLAFPTSNGRWLSSNNWRRRGFQTACIEAGLVTIDHSEGDAVEIPKYKPYDLRHFYASMLIENRVNLKRIQKLMGHSDIQTTLNIYGHVVERVEWEQDEQTRLISSITSKKTCGEFVASDL